MLRKRAFIAVVLTAAVVAVNSSTVEADDAKNASAAGKRIQEALADLAKGDGDWKRFSVTYDDLHGLHGGLTLTIHGSGKVTQKAVREKIGEPKEVSAAQLKELVELLQKHKAWEQKEPERPPVPDESRARLAIKYADDSVTIWEWYNDLSKNKRLVVIREAMKKAAWKSVPQE